MTVSTASPSCAPAPKDRTVVLGHHIESIDAIKGIAIVGVVLHHVSNRRLDPDALTVTEGVKAAFSWCVLVFFAVSGWLHACSEQKNPRTICTFLLHRARRLLLPFACLVLLYSIIWQLIQKADIISTRGVIPEEFWGKLAKSLWPVSRQEVGEQLYFLPLLFMVSCPIHSIQRLGGRYALAALVALSLAVGGILFRESAATGFSLGTGIWAVGCYGLGFLAAEFRQNANLQITTLAILFWGAAAIDSAMVPKMAPALFLALLAFPSLPKLRLLSHVGKASGTVFAYHTPFILQPLVIIACQPVEAGWQVIAVLGAACVSIILCTIAFFAIGRTRAALLLL